MDWASPPADRPPGCDVRLVSARLGSARTDTPPPAPPPFTVIAFRTQLPALYFAGFLHMKDGPRLRARRVCVIQSWWSSHWRMRLHDNIILMWRSSGILPLQNTWEPLFYNWLYCCAKRTLFFPGKLSLDIQWKIAPVDKYKVPCWIYSMNY